MRPERVEAPGVRAGPRTLVPLILCAAAAAATLAHAAIDFVGDYALPSDAYDHLHHGSRALIGGVALVLAIVLAARCLRACFEIASVARTRLAPASASLGEAAGFVLAAIALGALLVPAMEWLDGRAGGVPVTRLADAFGGSLALGLGTTAVCAAVVAAFVYALAHWLISHRDAIATIVATLLRPFAEPVRRRAHAFSLRGLAPHRRLSPHALRLSKRGPPKTIFA
jgi:hypothetical protein